MDSEVPPSASPRLVDVARIAGVSRATASRALAGYGRVSAQTIARVRSVADRIGYRPDPIAQAMRSGHTGSVGLVTADVSGSFFSQTTISIIHELALREYNTLVLTTDENLDNERKAVRVLLDKKVDGLIVVTAARTGHQHLMRGGSAAAPLVFLDRRADDVEACAVCTDDRPSAAECVKILQQAGHRKIGFITMSETVTTGLPTVDNMSSVISPVEDRALGWLEGMQAAGLDAQPHWFALVGNSHEEAVTAATTMLKHPDRPTAILAGNSEVALAIISACSAVNVSLPDELSLICFDDSLWASIMTPALTVVSRPVRELSSKAVNLLLAQINGEQPPVSIILPNKIIHRNSVAWPVQYPGRQA